MEPFSKVPMREQIRRERRVQAETRCLRLQLLAARNLAEAGLEERRLAQLSALPAFRALEPEVQGLISLPYVIDRAKYLAKAARAVRERKRVEQTLAALRADPPGPREHA